MSPAGQAAALGYPDRAAPDLAAALRGAPPALSGPALASTGARRSAAMPDLPALEETLPGYTLTAWIGLVAPAGVPPAIVEKLNRDVVAVLQLPETQKQFAGLGLEVMPMSTSEFTSLIASELPRWTLFMKLAGIQAE